MREYTHTDLIVSIIIFFILIGCFIIYKTGEKQGWTYAQKVTAYPIYRQKDNNCYFLHTSPVVIYRERWQGKRHRFNMRVSVTPVAWVYDNKIVHYALQTTREYWNIDCESSVPQGILDFKVKQGEKLDFFVKTNNFSLLLLAQNDGELEYFNKGFSSRANYTLPSFALDTLLNNYIHAIDVYYSAYTSQYKCYKEETTREGSLYRIKLNPTVNLCLHESLRLLKKQVNLLVTRQEDTERLLTTTTTTKTLATASNLSTIIQLILSILISIIPAIALWFAYQIVKSFVKDEDKRIKLINNFTFVTFTAILLYLLISVCSMYYFTQFLLSYINHDPKTILGYVCIADLYIILSSLVLMGTALILIDKHPFANCIRSLLFLFLGGIISALLTGLVYLLGYETFIPII